MKHFLPTVAVVAALFTSGTRNFVAAAEASRPPNIVFIMTDDQGYSDVGVFGAKGFNTPVLDQMAAEGMKFTTFYVGQAVCTASRAALMTGCYPNRVGLHGALNHLSKVGISDKEIILPQLCKQRNYATAIYGKWHLGALPPFMPTKHGFDEFFGIPYSNDNSKYHPVFASQFPPLPLYEGERVIEREPDQHYFTKRITEHAVSFIERNKDKPFFLYVPHIMPHVPIFASPEFAGKSELGLYGDVIQELDWSVGQILGAIKKNGLDERTLVVYTSDNGPNLSYGNHAGHAGPLREGKFTSFDGGFREPCIMRWPGRIPAGKTCDEIASTIDMLPTIAGLIGTKVPDDRIIDGRDIWPLMSGQSDAKSPHEAFYFYSEEELEAVRSGDWKLHFAHPYLTVGNQPGHDGKPATFANVKPVGIDQTGIEAVASRHGYQVAHIVESLFDIRHDPSETKDLAVEHPDIVKRLGALAEKARADLGDSMTGRKGANQRPAGRVTP